MFIPLSDQDHGKSLAMYVPFYCYLMTIAMITRAGLLGILIEDYWKSTPFSSREY
jgi:hypothetical protein